MIYAIHRETKEHREALPGFNNSAWKLVAADADGWIEWKGGECPLPDGHLVDIRARDGNEASSTPANKPAPGWPDASECFWDHEDHFGDIIAYRPILDAKPEAPEWDGEGGLPPVGSDVHWVNADADDQTFTVVAHDDDTVICHNPWDTDNRYIWGCADDFRPIRSEEEKAVEEMRSVIYACKAQSVDDRLRALYRAGFRKVDKP